MNKVYTTTMKTILRKTFLACLLIISFGLMIEQAQAQSLGINYQAVVRDTAGMPMVNKSMVIRISFLSPEKAGKAFYTEQHQLATDDVGQISLVIGKGKQKIGDFATIPWGTEQIWVELELADVGSNQFTVVSRSRLLSVPYAKHAQTASQLLAAKEEGQDDEKTQSIYWLTGGNSLTAPPTQFLGTRDAQDLVIKTNNVAYATITKEGQFRLTAGVDGTDDDINAYPLTISGSHQGIHIKVNGSRNGSNHFLTFGDDVSFRWGTIEGEIFSELEQYWAYKLQVEAYALAGTSLALRIAAWTVKAIGEGASIFSLGSLPGTIAGIAALVTEAAGLLANSITWGVKIREQIGVTYSTGSGDYAEWLERAPGERAMSFGEIVGVKGGKVSRNTVDADHYLVVSMAPAVLANAPQPDKKYLYEKVSFMGQVPVKVAGAVSIGDYILPSGNNDGIGIAVHPKDMKSGDFARVVGVAWEASKDDVLFNYINTAVGINTNDLSNKVDQLNQRVENILAYLEGKAPLLEDDELFKAASASNQIDPYTQVTKLYSDEEVDQLLDKYEPFLRGLYGQVEKELQKSGINLDDNPYVKAFVKNPVPALKEMRRNPQYFTQWALLDQKMPAKGN